MPWSLSGIYVVGTQILFCETHCLPEFNSILLYWTQTSDPNTKVKGKLLLETL